LETDDSGIPRAYSANKKGEFDMKATKIPVLVTLMGVLLVLASLALAAQDKYKLKALNGVAFSEIRGYETWQGVAPSYDNDHLKSIVANTVMINAYKEGIPGNGKPFPEGSTIVKISWTKRKVAVYPLATEPETLATVQMIVKDSQRFPETSGWGYARFLYDAASDTFKPYGSDSSFGKECYQCHTLVKDKDFIFTGYPRR
jgi:hypothetical protein